MGPGMVTTTGEGSMYTVESAQRARQGSLQLLARGVGPQGPQGRGGQGLQQDISRCRRQSCKTEQGAPSSPTISLSLCPSALSRTHLLFQTHSVPTAPTTLLVPSQWHGTGTPAHFRNRSQHSGFKAPVQRLLTAHLHNRHGCVGHGWGCTATFCYTTAGANSAGHIPLWLSPIAPLVLEPSPLFPAVPRHQHGKADGPCTLLCQGPAEAAQGSSRAASMPALQPTGRDGVHSGLPRSSRKGRPESRMQSLEQSSLLCCVPEPCGATNIPCS